MSSLLRISDDIRRVDRMIEDAGGEITPEIDAELTRLESSLATKAGDYAHLIREMERRAQARRSESKWLAEQAENEERLAENLSLRLLGVMKRHNIDQLRAEPYTLSIARNGGKLPMTIEDRDVPDEWKMVVMQPDKERIRQALEAGTTVPGASLGTRGEHLRIR